MRATSQIGAAAGEAKKKRATFGSSMETVSLISLPSFFLSGSDRGNPTTRAVRPSPIGTTGDGEGTSDPRARSSAGRGRVVRQVRVRGWLSEAERGAIQEVLHRCLGDPVHEPPIQGPAHGSQGRGVARADRELGPG